MPKSEMRRIPVKRNIVLTPFVEKIEVIESEEIEIEDEEISDSISSDETEVVVYDKDNDEWQKKEIEKRNKFLRQKFINVIDSLVDSKDRIKEIVGEKKSVFKGRKLRIDIPREELDEMSGHIESMNFQLGKASTMLDSYIRFRNSTPDLRPINNLIYELNEFVVNSQRSVFFQQHMIQNNKRYFEKLDLQDKVMQISFLIERILGVMETGGDFTVDVIYMESEKREERERGADRFGRIDNRYDDYGGGYGGGYRDYPYGGRRDDYKKYHEREQRKKHVKESYKDFGKPEVMEEDA